MSQNTPTIGLKKPEGSDPFLVEDFAANLDKIDAAFAQRPVGGGGGGGGDHPDTDHTSFAATTHTHTDYATVGHTHEGVGGGSGITQADADIRYAFKDHGAHGGGGGGNVTATGFTQMMNRIADVQSPLGDGLVTVSHSAGFTPTTVMVTGAGFTNGGGPPLSGTPNLPISGLVKVDGLTGSTVQVRVFTASVDGSGNLKPLPAGVTVRLQLLLLA